MYAEAAARNQVPRLSALIAILTVTRWAGDAGSTSPGRCCISSASSMPTCSMCRQSQAPFSVAVQGLPRSTSTAPSRSSSCLTRCEIAEGVTFNAAAALSKLPVCAMRATARAAG